MKTIKNSLVLRLEAQGSEAKTQGLNKVASAIEKQLTKNHVRDDNTKYVYSSKDFKNDVEEKLWDVIIRAADFYDCTVDAASAQNLVDRTAEELLREFRIKSGVQVDVGANEPQVPGEADNADLIVQEDYE